MSTRARIAAVVGVITLAVLAYSWWNRSPSEGDTPASRESRVTLMPLPDLAAVEESARQQLRERHAALGAMLESPAATASQRADGFGRLGVLLFATELWTEAEQAFLDAQRLAPDDMRWPYYLGHLYRTRQEPARAIPLFERALALAPDHVASMVWLGELHLVAGDLDAAASVLQRAALLPSQSAAVVSRLGRVALARQDYADAIALFERALTLEPAASSLYYPLGMAYRGAGQTARAESYLRRTTTPDDIVPPDPLMDAVAGQLRGSAAFEARGMAALDAREWPTAVDQLGKAVGLAPENAITRLNFGTALSLAGDAVSARRELLEAVRLSPDLAKAHFGLGLLEQDAGNWRGAVERFTAAVRSEPDFGDAHFALAEVLRRTGRAPEALAHYDDVLASNPAAAQARFGYAMALVRLRRFTDARSWLATAVSLHPDQVGFAHALARILAAAPDTAARDGGRALTLMQPLVTPDAGPAIFETMAMTQAEVGNFTDAAMWQERAIAAARDRGQGDLAVRMADNLALYRRGQPCRTPWRDDDPVIVEWSR